MTRSIITGYFIDGPHNGERQAVQTHPGGFAPVELRFSKISFDESKPFDIHGKPIIVTDEYRYRAFKIPKTMSSALRAHYIYVFIPENEETPDFVVMPDD